MLARANRVTRPADFRAAVRQGRRIGTANMIVHVRATEPSEPTRFGFIVTKAVGNSVTRNRVRRRLRAACFELLPEVSTGSDVVVRALSGLPEADWATLRHEIGDGVDRAVRRR